ncbi:hypothetical protein [Thermocrispum municipale]|uniref:hypothetical protein n=1 Tax=Thermocrispum municipale TaxID=37926 RepID=UPI00048D9994|nr:hypothetical protein [Thermocrispum municipale]
MVDFDLHHGERIEQAGVGCGQDALLSLCELHFELLALGPELGAPLVDVTDEVLVGVVDEFEVADRPLDLDVDVGDRSAESCDLLFSLLRHGGVELAEVGVEQLAAVVAEDVIGQEGVDLLQQVVLADEDAPGGWVAGGEVCLLGVAGVVDPPSGFAVHAPPAQVAEQVGAEEVGPFGLRVLGVRSGVCAGAEAVSADFLDLDEGVEVDQHLVHWFG